MPGRKRRTTSAASHLVSTVAHQRAALPAGINPVSNRLAGRPDAPGWRSHTAGQRTGRCVAMLRRQVPAQQEPCRWWPRMQAVRGFLLFTASYAKRPRRDGPGPG